MNVIKKKVISLKILKKDTKDDPLSPDTTKVNYRRRFSVPYGKIVESWKKENTLVVMKEEEYPIYQSASFRRYTYFLAPKGALYPGN